MYLTPLLEVNPIPLTYDLIFRECVDVLEIAALMLHITYEQINVWIFCIIGPIIFIIMWARIIYLKRALRIARNFSSPIKQPPIKDFQVK